MITYTATDRPLILKTALGTDALLVTGFEGYEAVSEPYRLRLQLRATQASPLPFDRLLGQTATLSCRLPDGGTRYFSGILGRFSQDDVDDDLTACQADLVPRLWLCGHRQQSRIFQQQSVPEILRSVLDGLDVAWRLAERYEPREYCVQYRESDLAFVNRLMEDEGIYYFFEHSEKGETLVLTDHAAALAAVPGLGAAIYDRKGGTPGQPRVRSWSKAQEVRPGRYVHWDHHFEMTAGIEGRATPPETVSVGRVEHALAGPGKDLEIFEGFAGAATRFDVIDRDGAPRAREVEKINDSARRIARLRMEAETAAAVEIRGSGEYAQFLPGHVVRLERHADGEGKYLLTRVEHQASQGGLRSGEAVTFSYANHFRCVPQGLPYRPQRQTSRPMIGGTQTAVVVGPPGGETYLDKFGRVKVKFPWDRAGRKDAGASCWIRVAQVWAGPRWGSCFWPRVGHEVVVAFEEGDPDRPIIVGSVYNAANLPPFDLPDYGLVGGIKSCSVGPDAKPQANFNGLLFFDQAGDEHLEVHSERDERSGTENSKTTRVGQNWTTVVGALAASGGSGSGGGAAPMADCAGSGSGGGVAAKIFEQSWGLIKAGLGRKTRVTVGTFGSFTLGTYDNHVVGQKYQITTNPAAIIGGISGAVPSALAGFAIGMTGLVDLIVGGTVSPKYGPTVDVVRGPQLTTVGKANALASGLAAVVNAVAIGSHIAAAAVPDNAWPAILPAKLIETAAMATLCGVETTLGWLTTAETLTKQSTALLDMAVRAMLIKDAKPEAISMAAQDHIDRATAALAAGDVGMVVHNCDHFVVDASKSAYLTSQKDVEVDGRSVLFHASEDVRAFAKDQMHFWAVKSITLNTEQINLEGRGNSITTIRVKDNEIAMKVMAPGGIPGPTMDLKVNGATIKMGTSTIHIGNDDITLRAGMTKLIVSPDGIVLRGPKIEFTADMLMALKSAVLEEEVKGPVKRHAGLELNN